VLSIMHEDLWINNSCSHIIPANEQSSY
jgi:hypothetical protein